MKERFLNIILFLISVLFIAAGAVSMFRKEFIVIRIAHDAVIKLFDNNAKFTDIFISVMGSALFAWGVLFLFVTVFAVMELKYKSIYPLIFWAYTFWAASLAAVFYLADLKPALFALSAAYALLFLPFFIALFINKPDKPPEKKPE